MLMSAELKVCVTWFIYFLDLLWVRYNCFIIVGYVWQILWRGSPHPWAAPKKPILNRVKDFFSKYDQIRSFLQITPYLLKKSLMENFIFCAVISGDWGELGISNLAWMSLVKSQSVLQNTRFTTFTVFELLQKNQQVGKNTQASHLHTQILCMGSLLPKPFIICSMRKLYQWLMNGYSKILMSICTNCFKNLFTW